MNHQNNEILKSERTTIQRFPDIDNEEEGPIETDYNQSCKSISTHKVSQVFGKMKKIEEEEIESYHDESEKNPKVIYFLY